MIPLRLMTLAEEESVITSAECKLAQEQAKEMLAKAGIAITREEASQIEVADLGLGILNEIGVELLTYVNTQRVCAKELVLFPRQICPEHRHPPVGNDPGKEETFRCRSGVVYLYVPGKPAASPMATVPGRLRRYFTVWHEVVLKPGDQHTLPPNTLHWFQGGDEGAIVSEFSTRSRDETDVFTDPRIKRQTIVKD
jgi:D-lyxose ketol-isomerase